MRNSATFRFAFLSLVLAASFALTTFGQGFDVQNETHAQNKGGMRVPIPGDTTSFAVRTTTAPVTPLASGFATSGSTTVAACNDDSTWDYRNRVRSQGKTLGKVLSYHFVGEGRDVEALALRVVPAGLEYFRRHQAANIAMDPNFNSGALYLGTVIPFDTDGWTPIFTVGLQMGAPDFMGCLKMEVRIESPAEATGTLSVQFEAIVVTRYGDGPIPTERPCGPKQSCATQCVSVCWMPASLWVNKLTCDSCPIVIQIGNRTVSYTAHQIKQILQQGTSMFATPYQRLLAAYLAAYLSANMHDCSELQRARIRASSLACYDLEPAGKIRTMGDWFDAAAVALGNGGHYDGLRAIYTLLTGGDTSASPGGVCWRR